MAFRRQFEPAVEIFQDPRPPYDPVAYQAVNMHQHMLPPQHHPAAALQPVPHYIQNRNAIYQQHQQHSQPHLPPQHSYAPLKSHSTNTSPVMQHMQQPPQLNTVYLAVPPEMSGYVSGSPIKKNMQHPLPPPQQYAAYYQPASHRPQKAHFNTFPAANTSSMRQTPDKENTYHLGMYEAPHFAPPFPQQPQVLGKRGPDSDIMSSASHDRNAKRLKPEEEEENLTLPDPEEMPTLRDDGGKPPYSYATLIGMAILRAPNRRLTLSQIYKWISDTFCWYRDAEPGWMNSIRHNLSLNKAFVKKERPKDDPGKGNYWAIEEGMEKQFLKDKNNTRRVENQPAYVQTMSAESLRPMTAVPLMETFALPPKTGRMIDSSRFPGENDASSDATLPDDNKDEELMPPPSRVMPSSPPHAPFDSSPPVHLPQLGSTPVLGRQQARRPLKDTFRDSGFFSSIESSVPRPKAAEPDREDVRSSALRGSSGRAEEELARIRGSSYDPSPTRAKSAMGHRQYKELAPPSSPTRTFDTVGFPPLTPAIKLNPSVRADGPSTISPNTNLRRHREAVRELVGTPAQKLPTYGLEELQWTPAFSLQQHDSDYTGSTPRFEPGSAYTPGSASFSNTYGLLWNDDMSCGGGNIGSNAASPGALRRASEGKTTNDDTYDVFFARGSPLKPAVKRPLIQRPASTAPTSNAATALASITGTMPPPTRPSLLGSPFRSASGSAPRPAASILGHVRSISRGSKDFGASFVNSPLRRTELAPGSDDSPVAPATPVRKSGLSSGVTVNSPGDSLSIWDAYLAGLEDDDEEGGHNGSLNNVPSWMEESKDVEGLDLAKGFSSIGAGLANAAVLATPMAPPTPQRPVVVQEQQEVPQQVHPVPGHLVRPSMMRRVTSQL